MAISSNANYSGDKQATCITVNFNRKEYKYIFVYEVDINLQFSTKYTGTDHIYNLCSADCLENFSADGFLQSFETFQTLIAGSN